jgi:hypothetical protein
MNKYTEYKLNLYLLMKVPQYLFSKESIRKMVSHFFDPVTLAFFVFENRRDSEKIEKT